MSTSEDNQDFRRRPSTIYYWSESRSQSTLSSNATASNLPGTGRVLGLVYDALGGKLETHINRIAQRLRRLV